ncbi:unnamed protein product [Choristocarpus tenellus]
MRAHLLFAFTMASCIESVSASSGGGSTSTPKAYQSQDIEDFTTILSDNVVSFSSLLIAASRAMETRRPDRLFDDPFAEILAGEEALGIYEEREREKDQDGDNGGRSRRIAIRTRFFDDFYEDCSLSKGISQVLHIRWAPLRMGLNSTAGENNTRMTLDVTWRKMTCLQQHRHVVYRFIPPMLSNRNLGNRALVWTDATGGFPWVWNGYQATATPVFCWGKGECLLCANG